MVNGPTPSCPVRNCYIYFLTNAYSDHNLSPPACPWAFYSAGIGVPKDSTDRAGRKQGIDRDDAHIAGAIRQYGGMKNLRFENVDILVFGDRFKDRFDIVTAARTIQWISEPQRAISNMKKGHEAGWPSDCPGL
jgi:hypothetical protein